MQRKYPTIYPVLDLKEHKLVDYFDELADAQTYVQEHTKEGRPLSVLLHVTKSNLVDFTLKQLMEIYDFFRHEEEKRIAFRKKPRLITHIMVLLGQKEEIPPKGKPAKTPPRKQDTTPIRRTLKGPRPAIKSRLEKATSEEKKPKKRASAVKKSKRQGFRMRFKLPPDRSVTTVELSTTGETYRLTEDPGVPAQYSARYFFHKYIVQGYDKETVLRKVKFYTGEEQNPNYYQYYLTEVKKLGVLKDTKPSKYH
jgi:hypothetical protein